jgi:Fe2+ or Zn2+ uptake regulation protein
MVQGPPAVHHHNVKSWGRAQDWQHQRIEQYEQTGLDESDCAVCDLRLTLKWKCPMKASTAQGFDSATANLG